MIRFTAITSSVLAGALMLPMPTADAQEEGNQPGLAQQCLLDLNDMAKRMQVDQFWLTGWGGGHGVPAPQSTRAPASAVSDTGGSTATTMDSARSGSSDPRGMAQGIYSPRHQIRVLYSAARVLAHQGEEDGCAYIVGELSDLYAGHVQRLTEAGVDPASITTWRQEQVALAKPLNAVESSSSYRLDDLIGTDVRNLQDEFLGTVSDVVIEPGGGGASPFLIGRAGFLGLGEDYIAVPWEQLRATPGLEMVVLDWTMDELEQSPAVDPASR